MTKVIRNVPFDVKSANLEQFLHDEWLLTNSLGGYASCSIAGIATRKYHGILIAALSPPFGRTNMLTHLAEQLILPDGSIHLLTCEEKINGQIDLSPLNYLKEFRLEAGLPVWIYEVDSIQIEKRIVLLHLQNTVHVSFKLLTPIEGIQLRLFPAFQFRGHEVAVNQIDEDPYMVTAIENHYEVFKSPFPPVRLKMEDKQVKFTLDNHYIDNLFYRIESDRGYESIGKLWNPGYFSASLSYQSPVTLIASTESWETINALSADEVLPAEYERKRQLILTAKITQDKFASELVLAADQFIITPFSRIADTARAHAQGDEIRTIIAGYHWFTDWGRDTMIALEGLTLCTGRHHEARWILRTFHHYIKYGLIPNMFPEGQNAGLYHTADATLWFFHALDRYLVYTNDRETLHQILPALIEVIKLHMSGTKFGIGVDPSDGLLRQGEEGYQLTWMDAKVGNWVVTPRRGKAVEINGLWYNALRLMEEWIKQEYNEEACIFYKQAADQVYSSFNQQFWFAEGQYLYDIVDGEDGNNSACRPNQLLALSLKYAVLDPKKWEQVVTVVQDKLLTPYGLRSLSPDHPDYKTKYDGDLRARDAAYHQGTVWAWLIGPFIDAWLKVYPERNPEAHTFLKGFDTHLEECGIGSISEIFDATPPYTARGCIAQAWSVAEVLRCWIKTKDL